MNTVLAFGMPGGWEWIVIILFVVVFFGAKKIPEIARGLGKGIREFKDATKEIKTEIEEGASGASQDKGK
ncbi:MAG: twin-arginine translocase TatA/TatE family subunit [Cyclobacteriaceae bacterium]|nr:twin-arginine translocase TatA/TatE family subunit [Cyclobacteriaceae bacterium HetDA_MAG_MS6]